MKNCNMTSILIIFIDVVWKIDSVDISFFKILRFFYIWTLHMGHHTSIISTWIFRFSLKYSCDNNSILKKLCYAKWFHDVCWQLNWFVCEWHYFWFFRSLKVFAVVDVLYSFSNHFSNFFAMRWKKDQQNWWLVFQQFIITNHFDCIHFKFPFLKSTKELSQIKNFFSSMNAGNFFSKFVFSQLDNFELLDNHVFFIIKILCFCVSIDKLLLFTNLCVNLLKFCWVYHY